MVITFDHLRSLGTCGASDVLKRARRSGLECRAQISKAREGFTPRQELAAVRHDHLVADGPHDQLDSIPVGVAVRRHQQDRAR